MDMLVRRVTPLTVVPDIGPLARQYNDLGFMTIDTGAPGCIGLQAGESYLILASDAHMVADFDPSSVAPLSGRTIPYIHVRNIDAALDRLPPTSHVLGRAATRGGTLEAVVEQEGQYMIFAERISPAAA